MDKDKIYALIADALWFVGALFFIILSYYFKVKGTIQRESNKAINDAESTGVSGAEKFNTAVDQLMACVPTLLKPIISRNFVEVVVQNSFDVIDEYAKKQSKK